jgi:hypothetical protein
MKLFIYSLQYMIVWSPGEVLDVVLLESSEMRSTLSLSIELRQQMDVVLWEHGDRFESVTFNASTRLA